MIVTAVSLGGGIGAVARYGVSLTMPAAGGQFPWATFWINVGGCFAIGVLMVLVTEVWSAHPLVRPFLGVGVLGGFTTFSTYAIEFRGLLAARAVGVAFTYLVGTAAGALLAVALGVWLTRLIARAGAVDR